MHTVASGKTANKIADWIPVTLRGGPWDGQTMKLPADQEVATFQKAGVQHDYHRVKPAGDLWHESKLSAMFGGGR